MDSGPFPSHRMTTALKAMMGTACEATKKGNSPRSRTGALARTMASSRPMATASP